VKNIIAKGLVTLMLAGGLTAIAAIPASATHPTVSGIAKCDTSTGQASITWNVTGDLGANYKNIDATIEVVEINGVAVVDSGLIGLPVRGDTVTQTWTQNVEAGEYRLNVGVQFASHKLGNLAYTKSAKVAVENCEIPYQPEIPAAPSLTVTPPSCDVPFNTFAFSGPSDGVRFILGDLRIKAEDILAAQNAGLSVEDALTKFGITPTYGQSITLPIVWFDNVTNINHDLGLATIQLTDPATLDCRVIENHEESVCSATNQYTTRTWTTIDGAVSTEASSSRTLERAEAIELGCYTPPVVECEEGTAPGGLNEFEDPTICVNNTPDPDPETPATPEKPVTPAAPVAQVQKLPYTGDSGTIGAWWLALLPAGGALMFVARKLARA